MDGWNTIFLLWWPIFRGHLSFRECALHETKIDNYCMSEIPTLDASPLVGCIIVCIGESSMWWKMFRRRRTVIVIIHPELVQLISKQNMILSALNHPKEEEQPFLLMIYFQDFWNTMTTTTYPMVRWLRENPGFASYGGPMLKNLCTR